MNQDLENYIRQARSSGQTDEQIKQSLMQNGWGQADINEAFGVPRPPSGAPPVPQSGQSAGFASGGFLDKKTKDTVIWSAVGYFAKALIVSVVGAVVAYFFVPSTLDFYGVPLSVGRPSFHLNIFSVAVSAIIYGAIAGVILAKFYDNIQKINRTFFGGWFNSLYRLIFYPAVISGVLGLIFAGGLSFSFFGTSRAGSYVFMSMVANIVATVAGSYFYAKLMVKKVGQYYP